MQDLEIKVIKKDYEDWCLKNNVNTKHKETPLLFFKELITSSKTKNKSDEKTKGETLDLINFYLENIKNSEVTLKGDTYTYHCVSKISDKELKLFEKLVNCIYELYDVEKRDMKPLYEDKEFFSTVVSTALGNKRNFDALVDICLSVEIALGMLKINNKKDEE